jgi:hypothetical protein
MKLADIITIIKTIHESKKDAIMVFRNGSYETTVIGKTVELKKS